MSSITTTKGGCPNDNYPTSKRYTVISKLSTRNHYKLKELPEWQREFNSGKVITGFLKETNSFKKCLWSTMYWHNSSINISLNGIAATVYFMLLFFFTDCYLIPSFPSTTMSDYIVLNLYLLTATQNFMVGTIFYIMKSHSKQQAFLWYKLNNIGLINHIASSVVTLLYYHYFDYVFYFKFFTIVTLLLITLFTCSIISDSFNKMTRIRKNFLLLAYIILLTLMPSLFAILRFGLAKVLERISLNLIILEIFIYAFGLTIRTSQLPERFFNSFDFLGNSENVYQLSIIVCSFIHFKILMNSYCLMHSGVNPPTLVTFQD
ncbi:Izh4p NDAI_0G04300 [Naumovozyma dairenensis CBS 421]|uniref:Uncharacterized protein n=1 Tax=Naumovozyma dairenensis (strain ATCC 10597 / BCRC 20456 / CBS 421 / NBRC 0211 / NRRL Y-12639) TaxID=1071378 RepID=J7SBM8_NAUDC|nr:hypothetical protein NDAI_0G04300 [Naumovozyma dairenensis CBS 421]CCK73415.1 hypothetical protein NDAI_0G04300 [Naumovozyma dairenensis CBS 421]